MSNTSDELKQLLERVETYTAKATEGPWAVWDSCSWRRIGNANSYEDVICPTTQRDGHPDLTARREDLDFCVNSRTDLPALCAALRELLEERAADMEREAKLVTSLELMVKEAWERASGVINRFYACSDHDQPQQCADCAIRHKALAALEAAQKAGK